jgi:hypothetical protein
MTCLEVRERLTEHALSLLPKPDAKEVDRHLAWCVGCRKESVELQEGAASVAMSVPLAEPHISLERRIVDKVAVAAKLPKPASRRLFRVLVAATLAATLGAIGATGWAIAERQRVEEIRASLDLQVRRQIENAKQLEVLLDSFRSQNSKPLQATLAPTPGFSGNGVAIIYPVANTPDLTLVTIQPPDFLVASYTYVSLLDGSGHKLDGGRLAETSGGALLWWDLSGHDLSKVASIVVVDNFDRTVLKGTLQPPKGT